MYLSVSKQKAPPPPRDDAAPVHQALPSADTGMLSGLSPEKMRTLDQSPYTISTGKACCAEVGASLLHSLSSLTQLAQKFLFRCWCSIVSNARIRRVSYAFMWWSLELFKYIPSVLLLLL